MKEVLIILGIIALVTTLGIYEQKYIDTNTSELITTLNEVRSQVTEKKHSNAVKKINDVNDKWNEIEGKLSILIDHEHIDNVGESITILKTGLEANENGDIIKEIDKAIFLLKDIQDVNRLKWKNVF